MSQESHAPALALLQRESQGPGRRAWQHEVSSRRHASLALDSGKLFRHVHKQGVTWIDLDRVENRYLLSGAADASVAIFDTQQDPRNTLHEDEGTQQRAATTAAASEPELRPLLLLERTHPSGHRFLVSCVCWYPVDTGLFVTGSYDQSIRVWDTNSGDLVSSFSLPARVTAVAMSRVATCHCLVAGACQQQHVRLCDPSSGAFTHTLTGHREGVSAVAWSLRSEFELATGDAAGQVRVWDIRRSGCLLQLDQYCTTRAAAAASNGHHDHVQPSPGQATKRRRTGSSVAAPAPAAPVPWGSAEAQKRAHQGLVTAVLPVPGGLYWATSGTDSRVRLWDACTWHNTLVSYPETRNRGTRAKRLAVSDDGRVLFNPCEHDVQVFDLRGGQLLQLLRQGHYGAVNCCEYSGLDQELFTGGDDGQILAWSPAKGDAAG